MNFVSSSLVTLAVGLSSFAEDRATPLCLRFPEVPLEVLHRPDCANSNPHSLLDTLEPDPSLDQVYDHLTARLQRLPQASSVISWDGFLRELTPRPWGKEERDLLLQTAAALGKTGARSFLTKKEQELLQYGEYREIPAELIKEIPLTAGWEDIQIRVLMLPEETTADLSSSPHHWIWWSSAFAPQFFWGSEIPLRTGAPGARPWIEGDMKNPRWGVKFKRSSSPLYAWDRDGRSLSSRSSEMRGDFPVLPGETSEPVVTTSRNWLWWTLGVTIFSAVALHDKKIVLTKGIRF